MAACLLVEQTADPIWLSSPAADTVLRNQPDFRAIMPGSAYRAA